mgnify:CR=1 FL=1
MRTKHDTVDSQNVWANCVGCPYNEPIGIHEIKIKQVLMLNKGSSHTGHGLSFLPSWTALQLGFPIIPLQSLSSFFLFVVVFVVVCNATRRLPCGVVHSVYMSSAVCTLLYIYLAPPWPQYCQPMRAEQYNLHEPHRPITGSKIGYIHTDGQSAL